MCGGGVWVCVEEGCGCVWGRGVDVCGVRVLSN